MQTLIVDDEPIARRALREELELLSDVEVVGEADNGRSALAARGNSPKTPLIYVRGSVDSVPYRAATVRERILPQAASAD